jgi:hypothetical protein
VFVALLSDTLDVVNTNGYVRFTRVLRTARVAPIHEEHLILVVWIRSTTSDVG